LDNSLAISPFLRPLLRKNLTIWYCSRSTELGLFDYLQLVSRLCPPVFPKEIVTALMNFPGLLLVRVWVLPEKETPILINRFPTPCPMSI
jgi:hypothetical protein